MTAQQYLTLDHEAIIPVSRTSTVAFKTGQWSTRKPGHRQKISPCREACPAGTNIPATLAHLSRGDFDEALACILEENPLPGICGRVCYHPCQASCNRTEFDQSVGIRSLERAIADHGHAIPRRWHNPSERTCAVAVVGSGPAGLSAAYFLTLFGHAVTIFESRGEPGGVLRYGIPEYRLPKEIVRQEIERILSLGVDLRLGKTIDAIGLEELQHRFQYVFLGTGAWLPLNAGFEEHQSQDFLNGLDFLSHENKESLCRGKSNVIVIGGGDVAVDVARTARRLCGRTAAITMVAPERTDDFPAISEGLAEAEEEGIRLVGGYRPTEFFGNGHIRRVRFSATKVARDSTTGAYLLSPGDAPELFMDADIVFVAIGQQPDMSPFPHEIVGSFPSKVVVNDLGLTPSPRFYAGGDLVKQKPAVADAVLSGKRAALAIHMKANEYDAEGLLAAITLGHGASLSVHHFVENGKMDVTKVVRFAELNTLWYRNTERHQESQSPPELRLSDFREVTRGLDGVTAVEEAKRCFYCGSCIECDLCYLLCPDISIEKGGDDTYSINADFCKGCSICATVCPRSVIEMEDSQ